MTVETQDDVDKLLQIGRIVAKTIEVMKLSIQPGMRTRELDEIGARTLAYYGATSAPLVNGFPGHTCISVNHEAAHGIPGERVMQAGDLVNIDVSAVRDGYYADSGQSFQLPPEHRYLQQLCHCTYEAMMKVISVLRAGTRLNTIGWVMQEEARKGGYRVVHNLCSHGTGRALHEEPREILPYYNPRDHSVLHRGQVITIEPFFSTGGHYVLEQPDGWTLSTPDRSYVAQFEHTIIITDEQPIIVTAL
ncbi:type I methionyl aminopeptidase [Paenibacillus sp. GCM10023252]|uniref:type I methionyl aminopeptidase n=1 Tax=Paenibacillus sp. GCM10023252 TaxID=3252649 RepID=UPI00360EB334